MVQKNFVFVFLIYFNLLANLGNAQEQRKINIAVGEFINRTGQEYAGLTTTGADLLSNVFSKIKRFNLVERQDLEEILTTQALNLYDIDQNVSSIVGKIKTIDYLVIGIINHLLISEDIQYFTDKEGKQHRQAWTYGAIGINIRIVDVETGEVVYSGSKKCVERLSGDIKEAGVENAANKAMANTLVKFEKELLNAFPLKGYIITIESAEKAIIDIGTEFSVKKGDKFLVFRPGKIIVHPVTNKELFSPRKEIAEAKVISADINTSLVEIKLKDKTLKIETGDYVVEKEKKRSFGEFIEEGLEPGRGQ